MTYLQQRVLRLHKIPKTCSSSLLCRLKSYQFGQEHERKAQKINSQRPKKITIMPKPHSQFRTTVVQNNPEVWSPKIPDPLSKYLSVLNFLYHRLFATLPQATRLPAFRLLLYLLIVFFTFSCASNSMRTIFWLHTYTACWFLKLLHCIH